jgi:hypothetical protein
MKKLLPILGITVLTAVACNPLPDQKVDSGQAAQQTLSQPDTTGMAAFNAWKAQNELAAVNAYQQPQQEKAAPEKTRTIVKYVPAKTSQSKPVSHTSSSSSSSSSSSGEQTNTGSTAGSGTANSGTSQTAEKKEGWSKAAKGAVIGGVAGAAGGAIINKKNRVAGAVIGGVIGAAGGYGIGRTMDKKDGRIDYSTILN